MFHVLYSGHSVIYPAPLRSLFLLLLIFLATGGYAQEDGDPFDMEDEYASLDSNQVNFSKEFMLFVSGSADVTADVSSQFRQPDYSPIWVESTSQDGVIGKDYQRIRIKFLKITKDGKDPLCYHVSGKSKVKTNINAFEGSLHIIHIYTDTLDDGSPFTFGNITASYEFSEDSTELHSGVFKGICESRFLIDSSVVKPGVKIKVQTTEDYTNNTFVGTWKPYKTGKEKKCIWGDGLLPYVFDFDLGTEDLLVNPRYKNNGWQNFGDFDKEYIERPDGRVVERDQWWVVKKK